MTFPVVAATFTSGAASAGTDHAPTLSLGTIAAGDLLVAAGGGSNGTLQTAIPPTGWTTIHATSSGARCYYIFARVAAGDANDAFVFSRSTVNTDIAFCYYRVTGWSGTLAGLECTFRYNSGDTTVFLPSHTASWGALDNLWIGFSFRYTSTQNTSWPTSYDYNQIESRNSGVWGRTNLCSRDNAVATENPTGTFTGTTTPNGTALLVVRPAAGGASGGGAVAYISQL